MPGPGPRVSGSAPQDRKTPAYPLPLWEGAGGGVSRLRSADRIPRVKKFTTEITECTEEDRALRTFSVVSVVNGGRIGERHHGQSRTHPSPYPLPQGEGEFSACRPMVFCCPGARESRANATASTPCAASGRTQPDSPELGRATTNRDAAMDHASLYQLARS